ncbi:MAG: ferrous iron transport protein B [Lachnospiraceae bacterium]|nr:ferrous iron transport protein B [Lachnospiraceae bacterium]
MSIKIALAGNPNCGKTTLFNALTGSNQYVGNWPGVTVEKKEGKLKENKEVEIIDLPGIYSLSPYTLEEVVTRNYLVNERPDAIINIVDGTNLERNLYLSTQIMELGIPVIMAVNMVDVLRKQGDTVNIKKLSENLGIKVMEISALKSEGINELAKEAFLLAKNGNVTKIKHSFSEKIESAISNTEEKLVGIDDDIKRFLAIKLLEKDEKINELFNNASDGYEIPDVSVIVKSIEDEYDDEVESIITNERYEYITSIIGQCIKKGKKTETTSDKIDKIVTNRFLALPIFAVVMFIVYYISVTTVGGYLTDWVNDGVFGEGWSLFGLDVPSIPGIVEGLLDKINCADWLKGLVLDGIVGGVGAVLGFVPQIMVLFIFLAFLEGCGYMARIAFIMDRIFRRFGLSGKSFIPMLIGSGCGIPGIMASRTIESDRDRKMTIMTTTFVPCGAKLPIIALIAGAVFNGAWWVAPSAYFVGIAAIICSGVILKKTKAFNSDVAPFVMELPAYHMPTLGSILRSMWERGSSFIKKAGTIILLSTIVLWFLMQFGYVDGEFRMLEALEINKSILARLGSVIAPLFKPLGFGNWRMAVAAVTGLIAKENVVGTFGVIFGVEEVAEDGAEIWANVAKVLPGIAAYSFLVFNLLCAPCFAAMGAIKREMNNTKWFWFAIGYQTLLAYVVSLCIYQIGGLATGLIGFSFFTVVAFILTLGFLYLLFIKKPQKKN